MLQTREKRGEALGEAAPLLRHTLPRPKLPREDSNSLFINGADMGLKLPEAS